MKQNYKTHLILITTLFFLGACSTVNMKIPNFDSLKLPEFREDAENIGDYQDWANAPQTPSDLRSAEDWDEGAQKILAQRDRFVSPVETDPLGSNADTVRKLNTLSKRVDEYKIDDPQ